MIWLTFCVGGFVALAVYQFSAGTPAHLPAERRSNYTAQTGRVLQVFAHGECLCTRASLAELQRVVKEVGAMESTTLQAFLFLPETQGIPPTLDPTLGWQETVLTSAQGFEERGITTSGHVRLWNDGELLFDGGVTLSRGHPDSNEHSAALAHCLTYWTKTFPRPVYGCSLY